MELQWDEFNANGLQGMEAFVNDRFSIHIVRYEFGEGFHWIARQWDEFGQCHVTGSYDYPETQDGWDMLTDAYRSAVDYMERSSIIAPIESDMAKKPSAIQAFLQRALQFGFATLVSISTLAGAASPVMAYADETGANPNDIYIEAGDGNVSIMSSAASISPGANMYFADSGVEGLVPVPQDSELYNMVLGEYQSDFLNAFDAVDAGVGFVKGSDEVTVAFGESRKNLTWHSDFAPAIASMYSQYFGDGEMHPAQMACYHNGEMNEVATQWIREQTGIDYAAARTVQQTDGTQVLLILCLAGAAVGLCVSMFMLNSPICGAGSLGALAGAVVLCFI